MRILYITSVMKGHVTTMIDILFSKYVEGVPKKDI